MNTRAILGDCLDILDNQSLPEFDLVYLDPPFGSQKRHSLSSRDGSTHFEFNDVWRSNEEYGQFLHLRLKKIYPLIAKTGSLFFHCDTNSSHLARLVLDDIFGNGSLQSEIVWHYKRWSNSRKGLLPAHQTILFYAKTKAFKFNPMFTSYSETTNADQILQRRSRDDRGKSVYAKDDKGQVIVGRAKTGVPLGDVWEIPFLNPKALERVGYPTQKPILLLERIINLVTEPGDWVLDPFCGSGTTLIAASLLNRKAVGIDSNPDAIALTQKRLATPVRTESKLLKTGRKAYLHQDKSALHHLGGMEYVVVPRNRGIDAILKQEIAGRPVFIRVQRKNESLIDAASALKKASSTKGNPWMVVIQTSLATNIADDDDPIPGVITVPSLAIAVPHSLKHRATEASSYPGNRL